MAARTMNRSRHLRLPEISRKFMRVSSIRNKMIRMLLVACVVMGSGVANRVNAQRISWLASVRAIVSNEYDIAVLRPAWCVVDWPEWRGMEPSNNTYDFAALDAMLALQRQNGISNIILHVKSPPDDVNSASYVTRLSRFVAHLAQHAPTAQTGLWIMPDNEPPVSPQGFTRHAAILKGCWNACHGQLKIIGCALQAGYPSWFSGLAKLGCGQWCDAISFHYYNNWVASPDVRYVGPATLPSGPLYEDILAIAKLFPGKPIFCDEFGLVPDSERNRIAVLSMLAAGVQFIQPFQWGADMNVHNPEDNVSRFHGDYPWALYRGWDPANNRPAPYAQCLVDLGTQIGSNPKATLLRTPSGLHVIKFSNGAAYSWNTNRLGLVQYGVTGQ